MKGRKIFGAVVPFDRVWLIGDKSAIAFHTDAATGEDRQADAGHDGLTSPRAAVLGPPIEIQLPRG